MLEYPQRKFSVFSPSRTQSCSLLYDPYPLLLTYVECDSASLVFVTSRLLLARQQAQEYRDRPDIVRTSGAVATSVGGTGSRDGPKGQEGRFGSWREITPLLFRARDSLQVTHIAKTRGSLGGSRRHGITLSGETVWHRLGSMAVTRRTGPMLRCDVLARGKEAMEQTELNGFCYTKW